MTPRSWLFVPADDQRKLDKAQSAEADALILDLEDSVAVTRKGTARVLAAERLQHKPARASRQIWVRINPLSTSFAIDDLQAVARYMPDGVVLPKPDSAADVMRLDALLQEIESSNDLPAGAIKILPIATETPRSLFALGTYADLQTQRLIGLTWGAEDLPAAIGAETNRGVGGGYSDICRLARALCLAGAAAAGVPAIETVFPAFRDLEGLEAYAEQGRREGFWGMMAIHPSQTATINRVFTPSAEAVERARRIVALFEQSPETGVVSLDGQMLDAPHLKQAERILRSV